MARIYGLNGYLRGRQGNNVFSIQNGTQVVKAYNPVVANPRTPSQQLQRAKFALAGKLSAATPSDALVGLLGSSARSRRADFVSRLVRSAVAAVGSGGYSAEIPFNNIIFSVGSVPKWSAAYSMTAEFVSNSTVISASVPALAVNTDLAPDGYGEMVVVGVFDGAGSPLDNLQCAVRVAGSAATFNFRMATRASCVVAAWDIPYVATSTELAMRVGNLGVTADNNGVLVSSPINLSASSATFGTSSFNNLVLLPTA